MGLQNRGNGRRPQRKKKRNWNWAAALFLVLFPPLGVILLWRSSWSNGVKYGLTGAVVAVLVVGVLLLPSAENRVNGGVELVGAQQEVEVYGPALPTAMVTGYTVKNTGTVFAEDEEEEVYIVYAAKNGECYHEYECKFAYASSQRLTLYEAYCLGYKPCGRCHPKVYEPEN